MKAKILFVLCLLVGLLFLNGGLDKFFHYMPMPKPEEITPEMSKIFTGMMQIPWLMPLIGFGEVLGGLLFIFPKTRALGAVVLFPILIGIFLTNLAAPSGFAIVIPVWLIEIWVLIENKEKYLPMIRK